MGFYLLDHPNPHGDHFYRSGNRGEMFVVHTGEVLPDINGVDLTAENLANYAATTDRQVSWHITVDRDSIIKMLPLSFVAWHVQWFNSRGVGMEIGTQAARWAGLPRWAVDELLANAAKACREVCDTLRIPKQRIRSAGRGIISHADLNPTTRTDPGPDFPWDDFIALVNGRKPMTAKEFFETLGKAVAAVGKAAKRPRPWRVVHYKRLLGVPRRHRHPVMTVATRRKIRGFQAYMGLPSTGRFDRTTAIWLEFAGLDERR